MIVLLTALLLTGAAILTACGGDNGVGPEPPDPPDPPTHPDEVTLTITPKDKAGVAKDATISVGGDSVDVGKTTLTLDYSETAVEVCAGGAYFKGSACKSVTPDQDRSFSLQLERKPVEYVFTYEFENHPLSVNVEAVKLTFDGQVLEPLGDSYHTSVEVTLGARAGTHEVVAEYGKAKDSQTLSADKSAEVTLFFADLLNCDDGIDNDDDGKEDETDIGCATDAGITMVDGEITFTYDPEDDKEVVKSHTRTSITLSKKLRYISNESGHQTVTLIDNVINYKSVMVPLRMRFGVTVFVTKEDDNQDFEIIIKTGQNHQKSFTFEVMDDGSDGWTTFVTELPTDFFSKSRNFKVVIKFIGEGSGKITITKADGVQREGAILTWDYETEDVPATAQAQYYRKSNNSNVITRNYDNVTRLFFQKENSF